MLPNISGKSSPVAKTIFVNPDFNKTSTSCTTTSSGQGTAPATHVNPLFLQTNRTPAIHMNPNFLLAKLMEQNHLLQELQQQQLQQLKENNRVVEQPTSSSTATNGSNASTKKLPDRKNERKLIAKTRTRIVREPLQEQVKDNSLSASRTMKSSSTTPLIRLNRHKLVRRNLVTPNATKKDSNLSVSMKAKINAVPHIQNSANQRLSSLQTFVKRYALQRASNQLALGLRSPLTSTTTKSSRFKSSTLPNNMQHQVLNINGVLYKSTPNKLQRKDVQNKTIPNKASISKPPRNTNYKAGSNRTFVIRGAKYIMSEGGYKLTRAPVALSNSNVPDNPVSAEIAKRQMIRIDIGGLTYVACKTRNVLIRTRNHLARAHLNIAKQRSVQLLSRQFVKSNIPCTIFQRLGKCAAFERGKCSKVHDKLQVTICSRFLRNECNNPNCLLSHNVSLSKMPTCKFYLLGMCGRDDCPYLHKKLSDNVPICKDFLQGYCTLAGECNKRHEFLCPEYELNGKCTKSNCSLCKMRIRQEQRFKCKKADEQIPIEVKIEEVQNDVSLISSTSPSSPSASRYFCNLRNDEEAQGTVPDSPCVAESSSITDESCVDAESIKDDTVPLAGMSRPKLGKLPAFIPL